MCCPIPISTHRSPMCGDRSFLTRRHLLASTFVAGLLPGAFGRAQAQTAPTRIISLDYGLSSTLLGLGVTPLAISDRADWGRWVREPELPAEVVDLGSSLEVNRELLAALKPDLILTTPYLDGISDRVAAYGRLLRLSVYAPENGAVLEAAVRATRTLAANIGREAEAGRFLERSDAFFEDCRARIARKAPPPMAFVNFLDARHARIYGPPGLFDNVLARIGVENAWKEPSNYWGFQTISIEELSRIKDPKTHLVAFDPIPGDVLPKLAHSPLWQALPFAQGKQFHILPPALMFGMVNEGMRFARLLTTLVETRL